MNVSDQFEAATAARLTDEDIERDSLLIGLDVASRAQEYLSTATPEAIRNFAASYGDDNPLFADPDYGFGTRWGSQIAPPQAAAILNRPLLGDPMDPEIRQARKGRLQWSALLRLRRNLGLVSPIRAGDTIFSFEGPESLEVRPSEFAGSSVFRIWRRVKFNQRAEVIGVYRKLNILTERWTAKERGKYAAIEPASYAQEEIDAIDAVFAAPSVTGGAEPRYWEDVERRRPAAADGEGPLTTTDIIVFHAGGYGFYPYGLKTGRPNFENRQRIPGFYVRDGQGIPDVAQRVHWDSQWANAIGNPMAYDYGVLRECWIQHALTNWIGDDGFLARQHDEIRRFNYLGDTTWLDGSVTGKRIEDGVHKAEVAVRAVNQRGEETARAEATVVLPSREGGPVVLAPPPADLERRASAMLRRHAELSAAGRDSAERQVGR